MRCDWITPSIRASYQLHQVLTVALLAASLTSVGGPKPVAYLDRPPPRPSVFRSEPFSPAKCEILYVDNPHPSRDVSGAVKVNVKAQCDHPVQELTLSVTLLDGSGRPLKKTMEKVVNKASIMNQSTYIMCTDSTPNFFQGTALGTSYEDGELFQQIKFGNKVQVNCGY
jgi:hypothetical protein